MYHYYQKAPVIRQKVLNLSADYTNLCNLVKMQYQTLECDPGFTFRHLKAFDGILAQAEEILMIAIGIGKANSAKSVPINHSLLNAKLASIRDLVPSLARNEDLLQMIKDACLNCFSTLKIIEYMICFIKNLNMIISGLKNVNDSYVEYACIKANGFVDFKRLKV